MTDDLETTTPQPDVAQPVETETVPAPVDGLTLVLSEFNGEHGAEHHWFTIPAGRTAADYQAELDAFLATRDGITLDDVTVTPAS